MSREQEMQAVELLADELDAADRKIADLEEAVRSLPCYVARNGEGTYECRVESPCPACALRLRLDKEG